MTKNQSFSLHPKKIMDDVVGEIPEENVSAKCKKKRRSFKESVLENVGIKDMEEDYEIDEVKNMKKQGLVYEDIRKIARDIQCMSDEKFALLYIALSAEYEKRFKVHNWTSNVVSVIYGLR